MVLNVLKSMNILFQMMLDNIVYLIVNMVENINIYKLMNVLLIVLENMLNHYKIIFVVILVHMK